MPGMAANPTIFEHIELPKEKFEMHWLEWLMPEQEESLEDYAQRMSKKVVYDNVVLIGVSFGGILVQEMSQFLNVKKIIIISSVKTRHELPRRMKLGRLTKTYKLLPTKLLGDVEKLAKYALGKTASKRVELYKKYLSVNDKRYLDWAIEQVVCWDREIPIKDIVHIHGDKDGVFPIKYIQNCLVIKGGTHIMIINRFKWFNEHLEGLICQENCVEKT